MDIPRKVDLRRRRLRRIGYTLAGIAAVLATTLGLSRLKPAAPEVDRSAVWIDTVRRGDMDIQVRGLGKLVPENILWIPAQVDGRVAQRLVLPGIAVTPDQRFAAHAERVVRLLDGRIVDDNGGGTELNKKGERHDGQTD